MLATEATALVHGRDKAEAAAETARKTFEQGALAADLPSVAVPSQHLETGLGVLASLRSSAGLVKSNGEARRQIQGGGLKVNDRLVSDEKAQISSADLTGRRRSSCRWARSGTCC